MEDDNIGCGNCYMPFDSQAKRYDHEPYCPNKRTSTEEEESEVDDTAMTDAEKDDSAEEGPSMKKQKNGSTGKTPKYKATNSDLMDATPSSICAHGDNGCGSNICNQLKKLTRRNRLASMSLEGNICQPASSASPVPPPSIKKSSEEEILKPAAATSSSFATSSSSTSNPATKLFDICSHVNIENMSTCDITKRVVQTLKECGNSDANKLARRLMDLFTIENADVMAAIIDDAASFRSLTVADLDTVAKAKQVEQRNSRVQSPLPFPKSSKKKGNKKTSDKVALVGKGEAGEGTKKEEGLTEVTIPPGISLGVGFDRVGGPGGHIRVTSLQENTAGFEVGDEIIKVNGIDLSDVDGGVDELFSLLISQERILLVHRYREAVSVLASVIKKAQEVQSKKGRGSNVGGYTAGSHCHRTKNGAGGVLGETEESLLQLPVFDEPTIKQWNDNPSIFEKFVTEDNKFVAVRDVDIDDCCLVKAVSSAAATKDFSFVAAGKRETISILAPHTFRKNEPPRYRAFPTRDGEKLASKIEGCFKTKVGEANCATDDLRLFGHLYLKTGAEFEKEKKDHMSTHADGGNSDGQIHVDNQQKGSKLPIREVAQFGPDMELELKPVCLVPDPDSSQGYRQVGLLKQGTIVPLPGVCKYILSFLGSGRGIIGLVWLDGKLAPVVLYHSIRSASGADDLRRIMVAQDLHPRSKADHDSIFDDWGRGKLPSPFSRLLSSADAQDVSAESILADLDSIEPFYPDDTVKCKEEGCHRVGSNLIMTDGGDIAFVNMQSTNGMAKDFISGHVVCDAHIQKDSETKTLCKCQKGVVLASMKTCLSCNGGRCTGRPSKNGEREFHCVDRTAEDITDNVGVVLDETNIYNTSGTKKMCKDCANPLCKIQGCKANARTGDNSGLCTKHGGGTKCKHPGCTKNPQYGQKKKGFCQRHGGGRGKCKQEGCASQAQGKGFCRRHGGGTKCKHPGCTKNAQSGQKKKGFCKRHGGGKK